LEQKQQTELAQVADTVTSGTVAGVIGKQKELYAQQAAGFDRDAEQKLAKIMLDTWSIQQTTIGGKVPGDAGIADSEIANVINKAKAGIDVAVAP
jgi:hypothetical protein